MILPKIMYISKIIPIAEMNIIHTADWHLGQTFYGYDRGREHAVFLDWLCCTIKEYDTDLLLIAGDVFDSPNPSAEAQRAFYAFLSKVTAENSDLQVIITAGNHDSAARLEAPNSLLGVFNTSVSGVVHYKNGKPDSDRMIVPLKKGGCCLAVPYLRLNDLPAPENYSAGVSMLYNELFRKAQEMGYSPIIAMGHLQASGAEVSVGDASEYAVIGGMDGVGAQFVDNGIAYTALGHLHKAQRVARRENVRYSGAPLPMSFAERNYRQSVTRVVLDEEGCEIDKIEFDAPVKLKSIPAKPEPIEDVIKELASLPDGEIGDSSPYLEINVLVKAVDPTLRQQVDEALAGKSVRLARILAVSETAGTELQKAPMTYDDFKHKEPIDIMREIYTRKCNGEEMPTHLLDKLNEVIKEIRNEDIGNQGM